MPDASPHLPSLAPIDAYGGGGFRFAGMSHRGSLLCLPGGIWAWPVSSVADIGAETLAPLLAVTGEVDFVLIGTGLDPWAMPEALRRPFRESHVSLDVMTTGAAVRTFNVFVSEGRRAAAGLIAIP